MADDASQASASTGDEFEREPVPEKSLLGFKSFIGQYAGEHCAGTELMIGPLFVAAGVSAFDLIVGLLLGNLLAVLSWLLFTAPIATRARLTLYYQLEKICGRHLVMLYNAANGVMFCFLAGAMITVSATAVGVLVELYMPESAARWFSMPELTDIYPNSIGWVLAVLIVGAAISVVAAYGYEKVAQFANYAAPWMVLVFLAFGLVAARQFMDASGEEIRSFADLKRLATTAIWTGGEPLPGNTKFTIWHVTFFAWFCNMAMHIGMSDLTIFRFARKTWYATATSSGMYVGHFMAWIAASMLFAYQLHETHASDYMADLLITHSQEYAEVEAAELTSRPMTSKLLRDAMEIENRLVDEGKLAPTDKQISAPTPIPGDLAYGAAGITGLLCVVIAGWTTANPTIYRAGLAFQAIIPRASRFKVTLITGAIATVAGMFPGIAMKLLDFVAIYGMVLMPMGAVVFIDFWLIKRLGLQQNYAAASGMDFNWAAGLAWFVTLGTCVALTLDHQFHLEIYFVSLPGWFVAAVMYIALSFVLQKLVHRDRAATMTPVS
jgi:purine-cytosine permease-like protein